MNPGADQVLHSAMSNFDVPLISSVFQDNLALDERRRLLQGLLRSYPRSNDVDSLSNFTSMLRDLIPESFDGEISNKVQLLFDPSNNYSLYQLTEFALYFLSNNLLGKKQTDEFLTWIAQYKPRKLLRLLFETCTRTVYAFSRKLLESTSRIGNANTLQLLMDSGVDKSCLSGVSGGRYLQLAISNKRMDVARLLLKNGVDVNPPLGEDPYNKPPLHFAAAAGDTDIVRLLIEAGARVDVCAEASTALSNAVESNSADSVDCTRILLEAGADVDKAEIEARAIVDWVYFQKKELYWMILAKSQRAKTSLTISGILCAANRGSGALSQYLNREDICKDFRRREMLELALYLAAGWARHLDAVRVLLEFGVDHNVDTVDGETPLLNAVGLENLDMVELLLDAGADVNMPDVLASAAHNFDLLNFLIERGADVKTFGGEALREAAFYDNFASVKLLLRCGANINAQGQPKGGQTPLQSAAKRGRLKMVKYLVNAGAEVNASPSLREGFTALQAAAAGGYLEIVKFLLDSGADVNGQPSEIEGKTALEASIDYSHLRSERLEIFQLLLDNGADINGPRRRRKCRKWNSVLTTLIARSADAKLIQRALSVGADVNQNGNGEGALTPIQAAAQKGNLHIVRQLLDKGAKINAPAGVDYGRTALQAACFHENPNLELIQFLLDKGAEVNAPAGIKGGLTALEGAAIRGHVKIALMLLAAGAEVNAEPAAIKGRTALDGAAEHGRLDMVQVLLNVGAKSEELGATGFDTAIKLAEKNGHLAVAEMLKSHSANGSEKNI
jgi:ankyrin repeat protein